MTPQFVITQDGLDAASIATPTGPFVHIDEFRIGTAFNYQPVIGDTALHGTTLFTGTPTAYTIIDNTTINVVCDLPASAGPYAIGEIGVYLATGELFALAAFSTPIQKYNISTSGIPHSIQFNCQLKLAQSPAVFNVTTLTNLNLLSVPSFAFAGTPVSLPSDPNAMIVVESNAFGDPTLLIRKTDTFWAPLNWEKVADFEVLAGTTTSIVIGVGMVSLYNETNSLYESKELLIRTATGELRLLQSPTPTYVPTTEPLNAIPATGSTVTIFRAPGRPPIRGTDVQDMWNVVNALRGAPNFFSAIGTQYHVTNDGRGYGQPLLPVPAAVTQPTPAEWEALDNAVKDLEKMSRPADMTLMMPTWSAPTMHRHPEIMVSDLQRRIRYAIDKKNLVHKDRYEWSVANAWEYTWDSVADTVSGWRMMDTTTTLDWGSIPAMTAFFNAGGCVDFNIRSTENSYLEFMVSRMIALLGPIRFARWSVESKGPLNIKYKSGDGYTMAAGPLGLAGTPDDTYRRMFFYFVPTTAVNPQEAATPFGRNDEMIGTSLFAKSLGNGQLQFRHTVFQTASEQLFGLTTPEFMPGDSLSGIPVFPLTPTEPPGSYVPWPTWQPPSQRMNSFVFLGRPSNAYTGLSVGYPNVAASTCTVTRLTTLVGAPVNITNIVAVDNNYKLFGGAGSEVGSSQSEGWSL